MSPTPDRTLDDLQQTIADLQRANAELQRHLDECRAERDAALERETATSEVFQVINSSPGDLQPIFEGMVEKAIRLCGAAYGTLRMFDGEALHLVAMAGEPEVVARVSQTGPILPQQGNPFEPLARGESVIHVTDAREMPGYREFAATRERVDAAGVRTWLAVALRKEDALVGAFSVFRREVRPFTDKQIALLQNFAAQAVIAMENARLITETREALEQQTATAEVLQVINSSPGDLAPVFEAMLEKATRLCESDFGILWTFDDGLARAGALHRVPAAYADMISTPFRPSPESGPARMMRGEDTFVVPDLMEFQPYRAGDRLVRAIVDLAGARSVVITPLRKDTTILGAITIYRQEMRPFSDSQISLLQNFAAQAVIAIENARLITETREALEQQTATAEVLQVINASPGDLTPVFEAIVGTAARICSADTAAVMRLRDGQFHLASAFGVSQEWRDFVLQTPAAPGRGTVTARVALEGQVVHVEDILNDPDYTLPQAQQLGAFRTALGVPLLRDGQVIGVIALGRLRVEPFSERQIDLVRTFAQQAVIAMENARLITETREALDQQTATSEVLGVINSSPGDLGPVFDAILEKARSLCGAVHGALVAYDGEHFRAVATHGLPEPLEGLLRTPFRPNPVHQALLRGERLIHIADQAAVETDTSIGRASVGAGARTLLLVPLRKDGALLGYITASRWEVRPFSDKEIALLENFAAQAVIAIENARLITETREALEQQTATTEVLQVINSSPGDLAPVFDAILEKAHTLCDAAFGTLTIRNGDRFYAAALRGVPAPFAEIVARGYEPRPDSPIGRLLRGEHLIHIPDLAELALRVPDDPVPRAAVELGGTRTLLMVPLRKDATLLGVITAYRQEVRPFSNKQIALLENFAAQAVIAMENARLITETREALDQQTATAEVLGVINSSPGDLGPVFDAILEKAHSLCGIAYGTLQLYDGETLRAVATRGFPERLEKLIREPYTPDRDGPIQAVIDGGRFAQIANLPEFDTRAPNPRSRVAADLGIRTLLFIPLRKDNRLLGLISAARKEVGLYLEREIALLENFTAQAVIAMENARLITETREALEQQTATAEVLQVINSSPGDVAPVFSAIVEKARRLCGAARGALRTFDGESFHLVAAHGGEADEVERLRELGPIRANRARAGDGYGRIARGERVVHIADLRVTDSYRDDPGLRERIDLRRIRTWLAVALHKDDVVLGTITVHRQEVRPFSDKEIGLIRNFADQAVIAIENARLLGELRQRTEEVGELNRDLEARVAEQVDELGRVGRLKRFLAPQLAELIVSQGDEKILESHRREIVVVFCDLRGYTAFTETAEPEEVLDFLREYHGALGPLVSQFEGTLDQFSGDGIMVFFNDPVPIPDPAVRAVRMSIAMREAAGTLIAAWRRRGRMLGFGAGIAQGYATLGQIGFADRSGYTAIGTVCNLAARLCAEAKDGQILVAQRVAVAVEETVPLEEVGELTLKGLTQPVVAFNVPLGAISPALRVIEGGSPQTV